ncbi:hypothetical protein DFH11DRAFT_1510627 [Phellopilus nigrolimitatus]|nr:hypothetical protein DFH11DRAFT_1510627 [Phellopilus nigrolimitatus]
MSSNNRASLLAGLRTGGVRSSMNSIPHSAAPSVSSFQRQDMPMTAAAGGSFNQMYPAQAQAQAQAQTQAFQMQIVQMEIMRLQALQVQHQYQMEVARQQQEQQQRQQQQIASRRTSYAVAEPQTSGPTATSFINRRSSQAEHLKSQLHLNSRTGSEDHQIPMTASLGGKFGGRLNPNATTFRMGSFTEEEEMFRTPRAGSNAPANTPVTPVHTTTVISGGTALGTASGNGGPAVSGMVPSKSDTSLNWRRGGGNSVLNGNRAASVNVKVTPPPEERISPPPGFAKAHRPQPLHFSVVINEPCAPLVIVDSSDGETGEDADDTSSSSSAKSEPMTPPSSDSSASSGMPPLSPREVAAKRLYEGLGIGRPVPQSAAVHTTSFSGTNGGVYNTPYTSAGATFPNRIISQPMRQPRGPPSGIDELGPKNFATRIRRKAIGGLGAMLDARVNRREVEAF